MSRLLTDAEVWLRDLLIRKKILFLTLLLTLSLAAVVSTALYHAAAATLHRSLQSRLKHVAATAALLFDPSGLDRIKTEADRSGPAWKAAAARLTAVRDANKLRFVYVMRRGKTPDKTEFIVDPSVDKPTKVGQEYDASRAPAMLAAFDKPSADAEVVLDEFGATLSGYAPIRREDGTTAAILGVDMDAGEVLRLRSQFKALALEIVGGFVVFAVLASLLFAQALTRPILVMRDRVHEISEGRLDARVPDSSRDELGQLSHAINRMVDTLSHYLPVKLVGKILGSESDLRLGGSRVAVTAFFSDIAGFTSISERLSPEEVVALLNEYLTVMSDLIEADAGTVDKFEGDAVVAYWGAPEEQKEHAILACDAALRQLAAGAALREKWKKEGKPEVSFRIGLNSGDVIAGNMGSNHRFNYTVMGDVVNLASRLESANKNYGSSILVGEATYALAKDRFEFKELDRIRVVGKTIPVSVYELLGRKGQVSKETLSRRDAFESALGAYRARRWDEAAKVFRELADLASGVYLRRIANYRENPPTEGWDGSHDLRSK